MPQAPSTLEASPFIENLDATNAMASRIRTKYCHIISTTLTYENISSIRATMIDQQGVLKGTSIMNVRLQEI